MNKKNIKDFLDNLGVNALKEEGKDKGKGKDEVHSETVTEVNGSPKWKKSPGKSIVITIDGKTYNSEKTDAAKWVYIRVLEDMIGKKGYESMKSIISKIKSKNQQLTETNPQESLKSRYSQIQNVGGSNSGSVWIYSSLSTEAIIKNIEKITKALGVSCTGEIYDKKTKQQINTF